MSEDGTPTICRKIKTTEVHGDHPMVQLADFYITKGHPIFVDGDWYRPDEKYQLTNVYIDILYNFYCQESHFLLVGQQQQFICSSLGGMCA
jgi:hypothetical protein